MMNELPRNYPDALVWLMKQKNITVEQLAEKAMVDSKTISRMRTKADYKPTLETVVAICIALQLDSDVSFELLKMAGRHLDCCSSERDCMLRCLLKQGCSSVQECNEILSSEKLPPLKSN
ncbi:helix-turn-helix transcriptional regulator [uncultured Megasphaera sp.]|jgi:transcriptional regulator with XRE-family HTH domain|uniref:helix-turn-helix domain-containing protein n=1 Tax=uncultured Megasphaera sp. TaxID=165188 RepID=UPI0027DD2251|nr:helix-turn-helix transcriptional regulator [uncultured Megasphaera sp.]